MIHNISSVLCHSLRWKFFAQTKSVIMCRRFCLFLLEIVLSRKTHSSLQWLWTLFSHSACIICHAFDVYFCRFSWEIGFPISDSIHTVCRLSYLNWLQFAWAALMVNQYEGKGVVGVGEQEILDYYSLNDISLWANIGYEATFFLGFLLICWVGLTSLKHQKR